MSGPGATPAGWYDDGSGTLRYWDGKVWTEHASAAAAAPTTMGAETAFVTPYGPAKPTPITAATPLPSGAAAPYARRTADGTLLTNAPTRTDKRKPHLLGIIALAGAAIGFFFACVTTTMFVGWAVLVIAFMLSLIALFVRGRKWPAITGLIVSVVGPVVAVAIIVGSGSPTGLGGVIDAANGESSEFADEPLFDGEYSKEFAAGAVGTLTFGETIVYEDGVELTVSPPVPYTPSEGADLPAQASHVVFTMTITNNSSEILNPVPWPRVFSSGQESDEIFGLDDDGMQVGGAPSNPIAPGESVTWNSAWSAADPTSITMHVAPDYMYEEATFTNLD